MLKYPSKTKWISPSKWKWLSYYLVICGVAVYS